jgi:hypothetical protein
MKKLGIATETIIRCLIKSLSWPSLDNRSAGYYLEMEAKKWLRKYLHLLVKIEENAQKTKDFNE